MSANLAAELYFWFIMFEVLPFIFYFILKQPHDCFICLGKDPLRRFSMFQLTREELRNREFQVKYGRGGFRLNGTIATAAHSGTQMDFDEDRPHSISGHGISLSLMSKTVSRQNSALNIFDRRNDSRVHAMSPCPSVTTSPRHSNVNRQSYQSKRAMSVNL